MARGELLCLLLLLGLWRDGVALDAYIHARLHADSD
jgi:hypothetical protein